MPYVRKGKTVYKKVNGLKKKGSSKSVAKAKKYKKVLDMRHAGVPPLPKKKRKKRRKK